MPNFEDHFSKLASSYAKYRPAYPDALFQYLAGLVPEHLLACDCGCGNGQASVGLARYFAKVIATDASKEQIANAFPHTKIEYVVSVAEELPLPNKSVDLLVSAQAVHWFNHPVFYEEVRRILKPQGVIAVWCYHINKIEPEIDNLLRRFHKEIVGPYLPPQTNLISENYRHLPFPFEEFTPPVFSGETLWKLEDLVGYLNTWSATQLFIKENGFNPVDNIAYELEKLWGEKGSTRTIYWPLDLRIGKTS